MNIKWAAFFVFLWFIGMIWGSGYEGQTMSTYAYQYQDSSISTTVNETLTVKKTFNYLFDFSNSKKETTIGSVTWKLTRPAYLATWFSILTLDFNFLKEYSIADGWHETTQSYFFKLIGTIGLMCFVLMFIDIIQGFIPNT